MEAQPPTVVAGDEVPMPPVFRDVPLPPRRFPLLPPKSQVDKMEQPENIPLPSAEEPAKPTILPKASQKGIEQAKKMLRAFSIQRKQTAPSAIKTPAAGPSKVTATPTPEEVKAKEKISKLKKLPQSHPLFKPLDFDVLNEAQRRKAEIAELGIPLSLIQPGDQAMPNKAWPSKAMPPTYLLSPDQVDELIMRARQAKAEGKKFKFEVKEYFPTYENPFQQGRLRTEDKESKKKLDSEDFKSKRIGKKDKNKQSSRWEGDSHQSSSKGKSAWHSKDVEYSRDTDEKDKEVDLNDYVVCDSWSLDTEDKTDDGTPKSEAKSAKSADEPTPKAEYIENKCIEVNDKDIELPVNIPKQKNLKIVLQPIEKLEDPKKIIIDTLINKELAKKKLRPVIDEFMYDLNDDSSENSLDIPNNNKGKAKASHIKAEKLDKKTTGELSSFQGIENIPMPAKTKSLSKSPHILKEPKDNHGRKEKSSSRSQSTSSRRNESSYDTPEYLRDTKYLSDYQTSEDGDKPITQVDKPKTKLTETPIPNSDNDSGSGYDKYMGSGDNKNDTTLENAEQSNISKEMRECLDMWNFVLKICQPLLFRHDRNKCYRETKTPPSVWYTENPRVCTCVKDRGMIYEELNATKMDLVDKVYGCDQILDENPQTFRHWYPKEEYWITPEPQKPSTENKPSTAVAADPQLKKDKIKSPTSFSDDQRNSLDREYEKFMEAVLTDKVKSPVIKKDDKTANGKSKTVKEAIEEREKIKNKPKMNKDKENKSKALDKVKEVTSEMGTSMDESVMSMDDEDVRKDKRKDNAKKIAKASSEYWSGESDVLTNISDEKERKVDKEAKTKRIRKLKKKQISSSSVSDSSDSDDSSAEETWSKESKDRKKKLSKATKQKNSRKRRLEKKRRLKKLKLKRLKKLKKLKEKVQRSLEDDEDVGEIIKKEKLKKKDELKGKGKKKTKLKKKKEESKKKRVSSSSSTTSNSSSSSSSSSSSDSEEERERRKKKKRKQKEAKAKVEKERKKSKYRKKRKLSESYSEDEEEFDMNILNNIKMEQVSEDEVQKIQIDDDFSPRRPSARNKEIVSVSELHSDFVGRTVKEERIDIDEAKRTQTEAEDTIKKNFYEQKTEMSSPNGINEQLTQKTTEVAEVQDSPAIVSIVQDSPTVVSQDSPSIVYIAHDSPTVVSIGHDPTVIEIAKSSNNFEDVEKNITLEVSEVPVQENATIVTSQQPLSSSRDLPLKTVTVFKPTSPCTHEIVDRSPKSVGQTAPVGSPKHAPNPVPTEGIPADHQTLPVHVSHDCYGYEGHMKHFEYENYEYMDGEHSMEFPEQKPTSSANDYYGENLVARPIETVINATGSRGEIKCDWRPTKVSVRSGAAKSSRWGMQSKPSDANIVLTSSASEFYPIPSVLETKQYRIETISNVRGTVREETDYDGAYADMYGEADRLQYGDCFATRAETHPAIPGRLSLDDRIGLVLQQSVLGQVAKEESPPQQQNETGILVNRLSPCGVESNRRTARASKRVSFADGFNPGQDSDSEQPVTKKKKMRRRYGCAWPCPATHPDHVPLWDALPPPPPPPGSPPPPAAAPPPPPHVLRAGKRRRRAGLGSELPQLLVPPDEPVAKITRLPKGMGHPSSLK